MATRDVATETGKTRSAVGRRGLMAGAAALIVGVVAQESRAPAHVAAADGSPLIVGTTTNTSSSQTILASTATIAFASTSTAASGAIALQGYVAGTYTTPPIGVQGLIFNVNNAAGATGVQGIVSGTADSTFGIEGVNYGIGAGRIGIEGTINVLSQSTPQTDSDTVAVKGLNLYAGPRALGVVGQSDTSPSAIGVYGTSTRGTGVFGVSGGGSGVTSCGVVGSVSSAPGFALYGVASAAGTVGFAAGGINGAFAGQFSGQTNFYGTISLQGAGNAFVVGPGVTKNAAVQVADGSHRLMHCVEAPEPWFEDFGESTLTAGKADVKLDPIFASTVDTSTLHVFLTPHDATHHLAVPMRGSSGFSVAADVDALIARGKKATDVNGTFTWRVVAKRKDVSGERLAKFDLPKEIKLTPPPLPPIPPQSKRPAPKA